MKQHLLFLPKFYHNFKAEEFFLKECSKNYRVLVFTFNENIYTRLKKKKFCKAFFFKIPILKNKVLRKFLYLFGIFELIELIILKKKIQKIFLKNKISILLTTNNSKLTLASLICLPNNKVKKFFLLRTIHSQKKPLKINFSFFNQNILTTYNQLIVKLYCMYYLKKSNLKKYINWNLYDKIICFSNYDFKALTYYHVPQKKIIISDHLENIYLNSFLGRIRKNTFLKILFIVDSPILSKNPKILEFNDLILKTLVSLKKKTKIFLSPHPSYKVEKEKYINLKSILKKDMGKIKIIDNKNDNTLNHILDSDIIISYKSSLLEIFKFFKKKYIVYNLANSKGQEHDKDLIPINNYTDNIIKFEKLLKKNLKKDISKKYGIYKSKKFSLINNLKNF